MSEWFPIETAPKGREILVCVAYNLPDDEWETAIWTDFFYEPESDWFRWKERIDIPFRPSHWMPLPEPPLDHLRVVNYGGTAA